MTVTYEQIPTLTRQQIEKEVRYLMKKREALEKLIRTRESEIDILLKTISDHEKRIDGMKLELDRFRAVNQEVFERLNSEKNQHLSKIDALTKENKRLRNGVTVD